MTPSPSFHVENDEAVIRDYVCKKVRPIFEAAVPQETKFDTMGIGMGGYSCLWRPNNYRREVTLKVRFDTTLLGGILAEHAFYKVRVSKKKVGFVSGLPHLLFIVGSNKVIVIWSQLDKWGRKEVYKVFGKSIDDIESVILERVDEIRGEMDAALEALLRVLGVEASSPPVWVRYEDWVKGESFIDSLPRDMVIHNTLFKKVYGDGLEFKGRESPGVRVKNFIKNRALEDFSPSLCTALEDLAAEVRGINPLACVMERVKVFPDDLLRSDVKALVTGLSDFERCRLEDWLFKRFG